MNPTDKLFADFKAKGFTRQDLVKDQEWVGLAAMVVGLAANAEHLKQVILANEFGMVRYLAELNEINQKIIQIRDYMCEISDFKMDLRTGHVYKKG